MNLPLFVTKKEGYNARFDKEKLRLSLVHIFRHGRVDDQKLLNEVYHGVLKELSSLGKDVIERGAIRERVTLVLNRHHLHELADTYDFKFLHIKNGALKKVVKRDGTHADFHPYKIFKSLRKSFRDTGMHDPHHVQELTKEVVEALEKKFAASGAIPSTLQIRDAVTRTLTRHNLNGVLKSYLLHRYR